MRKQYTNIRVNKTTITNALCAEAVLEKSGIGLVAAACLIRRLTEKSRTRKISHLKKIFDLGYETFSRECRSISFSEAYSRFLEAKSHLRKRSLQDYRQIRNIICRFDLSISKKKLRSLTVDVCNKLINSSFNTPRQRRKAQAIFHAFFSYCCRHHWCDSNPISSIDFSVLKEQEIVPLSVSESERLFFFSKKTGLEECIPAIALMLFAGIRPNEVERLMWTDINWEEKVISIAQKHSKTGGARHVSILPRLEKILKKYAVAKHNSSICPQNWKRKWKRIRTESGWHPSGNPWQQDVLRHTFASYHFKFFKDISLLQYEMGHASAKLLHSRYLSMRGITFSTAQQFWLGNDFGEVCARSTLLT